MLPRRCGQKSRNFWSESCTNEWASSRTQSRLEWNCGSKYCLSWKSRRYGNWNKSTSRTKSDYRYPSKRFKTEPSFEQPSTSRAQPVTPHYDPMSTSPGRRFSWAHDMNSTSNINSETTAINSITIVQLWNVQTPSLLYPAQILSQLSMVTTMPLLAWQWLIRSTSSVVGHGGGNNSATSDDDMVIDGTNLVLMFKVAYNMKSIHWWCGY